MAIRKLKPDTPSRRYMSVSTFEEITKKYPKTRDVVLEKENDLVSSFFKKKESPRKLAIAFQNKIKNKEDSWPQLNKLRP